MNNKGHRRPATPSAPPAPPTMLSDRPPGLPPIHTKPRREHVRKLGATKITSSEADKIINASPASTLSSANSADHFAHAPAADSDGVLLIKQAAKMEYPGRNDAHYKRIGVNTLRDALGEDTVSEMAQDAYAIAHHSGLKTDRDVAIRLAKRSNIEAAFGQAMLADDKADAEAMLHAFLFAGKAMTRGEKAAYDTMLGMLREEQPGHLKRTQSGSSSKLPRSKSPRSTSAPSTRRTTNTSWGSLTTWPDASAFHTPYSSFSSLPNSAAGASTGRAGTAGKKAARPKRVCKTVCKTVKGRKVCRKVCSTRKVPS